ncbi:MAG: DNA translocase FtsK 4TM domain-containing protein, partial [candidate division NC10 bacterium]|nr:DNA translocase FtsK 4TM domain-containing protein [candidate division NC10 bacterium]
MDPKELKEGAFRFLRHPKFREVLGVLLIACSILLTASLVSYDASDPSFFHYRGNMITPVKNLGGKVGAHLAGDLFELLGLSSFLLPLFFFFLGWIIFRHQVLDLWGLKLCGLFLLVLSCSILTSLLWTEVHLFGLHLGRAGGLLGDGLAGWLSPFLGRFGLYLSTLTALLIAMILLSQHSLHQLATTLVEGFGRSKERLAGIWKREEGEERASRRQGGLAARGSAGEGFVSSASTLRREASGLPREVEEE